MTVPATNLSRNWVKDRTETLTLCLKSWNRFYTLLRHVYIQHRYDSLCLCNIGGFYTKKLFRSSHIRGISPTRICDTLHNTAHKLLYCFYLLLNFPFCPDDFYHRHNIYAMNGYDTTTMNKSTFNTHYRATIALFMLIICNCYPIQEMPY